MTDLELRDDLAAMAARLIYLTGQRAEIDAEINDIKAKLRSTVPVGARATIEGRPVLAVSANRRFDVETAMAKLPPDLIALCMKTSFDPKMARVVLPPAIYDSCMRDAGEPVVRTL